MILRQLYLDCLAHASYLIGDESTGVAAVVDPRRDVEDYLGIARELGLRIEHVLLTHFHADFVAGHLDLARRTGARIHLGAAASAEFDFRPAHDGDVIELGAVRLGILSTPGHTPESICITVTEGAAAPHAVLTGDTLFIGDVGRPDLMASVGVTAEQLATDLYRSLHGKLLTLPDATLVYPAHGAGSMCGRNLGSETVSTIGRQRQMNYALAPMTEAEFVRQVTTDQPTAPRYFARDARLNREVAPSLDSVLERGGRALSLDEVVVHAARGVQLVDVRSESDHAACHLRGSINIGLSGKFATWAGSVLDPQRSLIVIADPGRETEAVIRLARVGLDDILGHLADPGVALAARPELIASTERVPVGSVEAIRREAPAAAVLDVRTLGEWSAGHVAGSVHIPLAELPDRLREVPDGQPLLVICRSGYRSSCAVGLLRAEGRGDVRNVVGGMDAWVARGLSVAMD